MKKSGKVIEYSEIRRRGRKVFVFVPDSTIEDLLKVIKENKDLELVLFPQGVALLGEDYYGNDRFIVFKFDRVLTIDEMRKEVEEERKREESKRKG